MNSISLVVSQICLTSGLVCSLCATQMLVSGPGLVRTTWGPGFAAKNRARPAVTHCQVQEEHRGDEENSDLGDSRTKNTRQRPGPLLQRVNAS